MKRWFLIGMVSLVGIAQALPYALQEVQKRADQGDVEAQKQMADYYRNSSEDYNPAIAKDYYQQMEAQGDARGTENLQEMDEDSGATKVVKGILTFVGFEPSDWNVTVFWFLLGVAAVFFPPLWFVIILAVLSVLVGC